MARHGRSGKQPPQQRETQKESKKTLGDACRDIKKDLTAECQARLSAEKSEQDRRLEDEQMALIYGPTWRYRMPAWAPKELGQPSLATGREPFADNDEEDTDSYEESRYRKKRKV